MAELMAVVVFPSWGRALVTMMTFGGAPRLESNSEVRRARYDSAICDWGRTCVTSSTTSLEEVNARRFVPFQLFLDLEPSGIMPSDGSAEIICACSVVLTVLYIPSNKKARPTPEVMPRTRANKRLRGMLGSTGPFGGRAASTMRKLLERRPAVTPACLSFSRRPS